VIALIRACGAWLRTHYRWVLAPVLAYVVLAVWAFASPIGSSPDDDFHLASVWCAKGDTEFCQPGSTPQTRVIPVGFDQLRCYAMDSKASAACQVGGFPYVGQRMEETNRGNFAGKYPPVYYAAMSVFAGPDVQASALVMRLVNVGVLVGLASALVLLLPAWRRRMALWGWLITLVPLGVFLVASNNPSGWAITGVGVAFLGAVGWWETTGVRRWALGAIYLVGMLMAAGARGDAALIAMGAAGTATMLSGVWTRGRWSRGALLSWAVPLAGVALAVMLWTMSDQSEVVVEGFPGESGSGTGSGSGSGSGGGSGEAAPPVGMALVAYNLLMTPHLWSGVFGTWGLGWFDTLMPAIVPWAATAAFVAVGWLGLGLLGWRKSVAIAGVMVVLVGLPVYTLSVGGEVVGASFQPRYLLPAIVLLAMLLTYETPRARLRVTRLQLGVVMVALTVAVTVALQVNLRRYVTGADAQGPNLDVGAEWWWPGAVLGPQATWMLGSVAFGLLMLVLWKPLRSADPAPAVAPSPSPSPSA